MALLIEKYNFKFIAGVGNYKKNEVCVVSGAVAEWRLRNGEPLGKATDKLDCACPVIRPLCVHRNDMAIPDEERKTWALAMIPRLLGSKDDALTVKRARIVALYVLRVIAPRALRSVKCTEEADQLAALPDDVDLRSAARIVCYIARQTNNVFDPARCALNICLTHIAHAANDADFATFVNGTDGADNNATSLSNNAARGVIAAAGTNLAKIFASAAVAIDAVRCEDVIADLDTMIELCFAA